jgi:hypothetical protein
MTLEKINTKKFYSKYVPSKSGENKYLVARWPSEHGAGAEWKCTCPDFFFRTHEDSSHICKHIRREKLEFAVAYLKAD